MKNLRDRLTHAYQLSTEASRKAQVHQKEGYDIKVRGATIQKGDRVLVRQVSFDGKHKLADTWEKVPYVVVDQANSEIPVFNVTREDGEYFTETYYYLWDLSENRKFYQKNQNQFQDRERDNRSQYW